MPTQTNNSIPSTNKVSTSKPEKSLWRIAWTKATFLSFCWISFLLTMLIGLGIFFLIKPRIFSIDQYLMAKTGINFWIEYILIAITMLFYLMLGIGLLLITITSLTGVDLLYPHNHRSITVKLLFPVAATLSQFFRINRNKLRVSFIKVNNSLTIAQRKRIKGDRIMILLPHCLQIDRCNRKITTDIHNCKKCGQCPVGELLKLEEKYNLTFEIVNGGTLARRKVASFKPSGIVAVACERDLTFGIQDVYPIPVYGVINDRPNGPCFNTCVDMTIVEEAIRFFKENQSENIASAS